MKTNLFLMLGVCLAACGGKSSNGGDGGNDGGWDGSSGGDNGGGSTVKLNASLGIWLTQHPITNGTFKEGPVTGWFMLQKDGDDLAGATVKINGVLIPEAPGGFQSPGTYDPGPT